MDDAAAPQHTTQTRLKTQVVALQDEFVKTPRFRPADVTLAKDYDDFTTGLMRILVELSAVAAVDKLNTAVAVETIKERRAANLARAKLRDETDVAFAKLTADAAAEMLPFVQPKKASA